MLLKYPSSIDMSDDRGVVNRRIASNSHQLRLGHHRVASIRIQANLITDARTKSTKVPAEIYCTVESVKVFIAHALYS